MINTFVQKVCASIALAATLSGCIVPVPVPQQTTVQPVPQPVMATQTVAAPAVSADAIALKNARDARRAARRDRSPTVISPDPDPRPDPRPDPDPDPRPDPDPDPDPDPCSGWGC